MKYVSIYTELKVVFIFGDLDIWIYIIIYKITVTIAEVYLYYYLTHCVFMLKKMNTSVR